MTPREFDTEEQEVLASFERGEWKSIPTLAEELQHYQAYAAATIGTNRLISIDLSPDDLQEVQQKARAQGVPYQKLIADIIHKFVAGRLIEQP